MNKSLRAIQADITQLEVDAIVNAANSSLLGGGGGQGEPEALSACYRRSLEIAVAAVKTFLATTTVIQDVIFCCFSANDLAIYERKIM